MSKKKRSQSVAHKCAFLSANTHKLNKVQIRPSKESKTSENPGTRK